MSTSGKPKDNNRCFLAFSVMKLEGEGVTELQPGDHVLPVFTGECKECAHCNSKESNMCDLLRINTDRGTMINDGESRFSKDGKPIYHFLGTSTFSEYTVCHVGSVAKINPATPLDKVCVISCGICTGFGATVNVAKPKKGSSIAIFGLGAVGLAVYDVSTYLDDHPGGDDVLLAATGRDATEDFEEAGHSKTAREEMRALCIGEVDTTSSDIPELEIFPENQPPGYPKKLANLTKRYWAVPVAVVGISVVIGVLYLRKK